MFTAVLLIIVPNWALPVSVNMRMDKYNVVHP